MEQTIEGFSEILTGKYDHLPEVAFYMVGDISEVIFFWHSVIIGILLAVFRHGEGGGILVSDNYTYIFKLPYYASLLGGTKG